MTVIWTEGAVEDLDSIVRRIAEDRPDAALRVGREIFETVLSLRDLPFRGRKRREDSSREIVFAPWPYLAVYEVIGNSIYVKAILHTSRDRAH